MKFKKITVACIAAVLIFANSFPSFASGWVQTHEGWKYDWGNQNFCVNNWVHYKNHWFYFGSDQIMRTGWIQKDGVWYFAADSGELQGGLIKVNGNAYYMDSNTLKLQTGTKTIMGRNYIFTENGTLNGSPYIYQEWNSDGTIRRGVKFGV